MYEDQDDYDDSETTQNTPANLRKALEKAQHLLPAPHPDDDQKPRGWVFSFRPSGKHQVGARSPPA